MKSEHVIRRKLADGTVKEYRYDRHKQRDHNAAGSIGALVEAYKRSPEWAAFRPNTKMHKVRNLRELDPYRPEPVAGVRRRFLLAVRDAIATTSGNGAANRFIADVSALFTWAVDREWIETNPLARVRSLPGGHWRAWTAADYTLIMSQLPEPVRRAVVLARYTGQRRGDLCAMRWSQYDGKAIRLVQEKTGKALVIPVADDLRAELDAWRSGQVAPHPERHILLTDHGIPWRGQYLSQVLLETVAAISPKFRGLNVHGLRKLAAATLAECGCSANEIAAITGHDTLGMVTLYTASAEQERLATAAVKRLDKRSV